MAAIPHPTYVVNSAGIIIDGNKALEQLTGWSLEELLGQRHRAIFAEEAAVERIGEETIAKGHVGGEELTLLTEQGGKVPVIIFTGVRMDDLGNASYVVTLMDITERKQMEEKVKQAAKEWRTTFDSITDLVSIHDKDFKIARVNKAFADAFKMKPKELVGKSCYEIVHGTNEPVPNCPHVKTLETARSATEEFFEPRSGIYLEVAISPIFNEKGEVVASVHVARDITERKRMEKEIRELYEAEKRHREELEEEAKARSQFINVLAHELRN
jgi:PAS domain S-box-containing protein